MNLRGRRIHIVGSAHPDSDQVKLTYVHNLIAKLTTALIDKGATFVIPFSKEPLLRDRENGPSIIFDWTVSEKAYEALCSGSALANGPNGRFVATIATSKTDSNIPESRRSIYEGLRDKLALSMEVLNPGWTAGAIHRERLAQLGDILIGVSGGQGVEHLAVEYSSKGKPVIPLDIKIGSSQNDGSGGAGRLFEKALATPNDFFRVEDGESAANLLDRTRTRDCTADTDKVVTAIIDLLQKLLPPRVFYVRLLNPDISENASVEKFFRGTVDPFVKELGYEPLQMGIGKNEFAWMNKAIFDSLHHSSVVLVDVTAQRPNCFMELGYALGNIQRVILTARKDTRIAFDVSALEAFQWEETEDPSKQLERFRAHWERNINMPNLGSVYELSVQRDRKLV
jgi:hypothetical protein